MSSICPFASPIEWKAKPATNPVVVQASLAPTGADWMPEAQWEAPTVEEWRRAVRIIAFQLIRHISGLGDDRSIDDRLIYAHDKLLPRLKARVGLLAHR